MAFQNSRIPYRLCLLALACTPVLPLTGCGSNFDSAPELNTSPLAVQGRAMGGQQPIVGALVTVYEVGSSGYGAGATSKASTTTDSNGNFSFPASSYTCTASNSPMYITATGGNPGGGNNANVALIAALGPCSAAKTTTVIINEVTTAATVEALGQFMGTTLGASGTANIIGGTCSGCATGTYNRGLVKAMTSTYPQLVNNGSGAAVATHNVGQVTVTTESAKINTVANILAACINSQGQTNTTETTSNCGKLFNLTNRVGSSTRPSDTLQAALEMQLYPYQNVATLFSLQSATAPFVGLGTAPNDWTVALSYTTPNLGLGIAQNTSSTIDIDNLGRIWVPSNKSTAHGLAYFDPSSTTFSSVNGFTYVLYPQYVALDQNTTPVAYTTDIASNFVVAINSAVPSSTSSYVGSNGYVTGGPLALDASNNILLAADNGNSHTLFTIKANRQSLAQAVDDFADTFTPSATPNAVAVPLQVPFTNGYLFVGDTTSACNLEFSPGAQQGQGSSYPTGNSSCVVGGMVAAVYNNAYMTSSNNTICLYVPFQTQYNFCRTYASLNVPKAFALDGTSRFWIANAGNASVSDFTVNPNNYAVTAIGPGYIHNSSNGGTLTTPYGLAIDGSGNVWVSNAGCVSTSSTRCNASSFTLSEIVGVAGPSITPLSYQEIGSNPASGNRPTN